MIKEAIILAGGLGTRLRSVVSDLPKCLAPVAGKPFLHYVIDHLKKEGITNFIISVGYRNEDIIHFIDENFPFHASSDSGIKFQFSIEEEPLGTGGAIKLSCKKLNGTDVIICNGDTLFEIDIKQLSNFHHQNNADCSLSLKPMTDFERYGVVELHKDQSIRSFKEKQFYKSGLINGGVYALNASTFCDETLPDKFSFEKDYLEKFVGKRKMYGLVQEEYFIDIGIPEDFERAQSELSGRF
ncbi:MAG: nucleotidyltransferase family protein [Ginsengibacter sp.]